MADQSRDPNLPTLTDFVDPLLKVLGQKTSFKPGVFLNPKDVVPDVIREKGFDPTNLSQYGKPEDGWTYRGEKPAGMSRNVSLAYRKCFNYKYASRKNWVQLTIKAQDVDQTRGWMALTDEGVEVARALCGMDAPTGNNGQNATSQFLNKRLAETGGVQGTLYTKMRSAVGLKLPISASSGMVDDHIQNCFLKLIQRDSLRERIKKGENITDSHLATYAVRTGFTDIRKDGTEPVCREMYGARTERERAKRLTLPAADDERLTWIKEDDGTLTIADVADTESGRINDSISKVYFDETWDRITEILKTKKPKSWERYVLILQRVTAGWTVKDIADAEPVSTNRASALISEARKCVRDSKLRGSFEGVQL